MKLKRVSWVIVWAMLPATALLAFNDPQAGGAGVTAQTWMGVVTLLGSFAAAYLWVRRPRQSGAGRRTGA